MEDMLKKLFDYQKFEKNQNLEKVIKSTKDKYSKKLSDDTLYLLNAAGDFSEIDLLKKTKDKNAYDP